MGLMCLLASHLLQCRSSLCLHPRSKLKNSYVISIICTRLHGFKWLMKMIQCKWLNYSSLPKPSGLEPHHQMQFSILPRILIDEEGLTLQQRFSRRILESKSTGWYLEWSKIIYRLSNWGRVWYGTRYYLPTPPLGQDMTQGQFLSGVYTGLNSEFSFS